MITSLESSVRLTFNQITDRINSSSQAAYYTYLTFQLILLLLLRRKLIEYMSNEVHQSRGILNMIPEEFFEEHS